MLAFNILLVVIIVAFGFIAVYVAYKVEIKTNFDLLMYFLLIMCIIVLFIHLRLRMSERNKPIIKDYVDGKVEMVIKETKENDKVIERDTIFRFKEE